jgi:hypothetical protein
MEPERTLRLAMEVGAQTLAMAQGVVHHVVHVWAPDCAPRLLTDGVREYLTAFLTHYGPWVQPPRRPATGPAPKPRGLPLPGLRYAQGIKTVRRRRLGHGRHRVGFGPLEAVPPVFAACGWPLNTAFLARFNLSMRPQGAAGGRRVTTLWKGAEGFRQQGALSPVDSNCCLPHATWRQPLLQAEPTLGSGAVKRWQPRTPAMAAGLTEHVWTLREVVLCRVPPWPPPATV